MINYYKKEYKLMLAVDCTIFGFDHEGLKILLIRRAFQPQKGKWSLVGGFLKRKETLPDAAGRILKTIPDLKTFTWSKYIPSVILTGIQEIEPFQRRITLSSILRNTHLILTKNIQPGGMTNLPKLIFDHSRMVKYALDQLRQKASTEPISFELLPEKFTMPQLKKVYEAIWNTQLDKRNFINKINSFHFLKKLDEKEKTTSKRGAFYYKFDRKLYAANNKGNFNLKY
jgi:ADP-ribose pyrophosphatase YjhB (NUDIX family)